MKIKDYSNKTNLWSLLPVYDGDIQEIGKVKPDYVEVEYNYSWYGVTLNRSKVTIKNLIEPFFTREFEDVKEIVTGFLEADYTGRTITNWDGIVRQLKRCPHCAGWAYSYGEKFYCIDCQRSF